MKMLQRILPKTHQNRIISLVLFFGLIFTLYNATLMARFENRFLKETAEKTVQNQHTTITPILADALLFDDIFTIFRIIDTITTNIPFISNIYISGKQNEYITDAKVTRKLPVISDQQTDINEYRYYIFPIQSKLQNIGTIYFEIDQNILSKQIRERLISLILMAIVGTLLVAYGSFKSVIFLLKPLKNISKSITTMDVENLPVYFDLPEYTSSEVRKLANTLHTMSLSLKQAIDINGQQERELAQQEKLASIGMVSAGLAHELKNPAMTLKLLTQTIMKEHAGNPSTDLLVIEHEVNRIVATIESFQQYSKPMDTVIETISTKQLARNIASFSLQYLSGLHLEISIDSHFEWQSDKSILNLAIENLLKNAHEARATECVVELYKTENTIIITVTDNGTGISQESIDKIFLPFYSTKSKGTGLGLAFVEMMLSKISGTIEIDLAQQIGSKFIITLRENI